MFSSQSLFGIELDSIYFFALMQKGNKKDQGHNQPSFTTNLPTPINNNQFIRKPMMIQIKKYQRKLFSLLIVLIAVTASAQQISTTLIGTNLWYKDLKQQVWDMTKNAGVKVVRIGGAAYDKNMPPNETLADWVRKIQAMGAEPVMQVPQYQSPEFAAAIVRYFNIEKHEGIKPITYWNIGNEPWLQNKKPAQSKMGDLVAVYFKPIAAAMKAVDSTIKIYGPDECDYQDYYNDLFGGKNDITGLVPGKNYYYCDGLTWHRYPQSSEDPATVGPKDFYTRSLKSKEKVDQVNALHNRTGEVALQWGIGEYNAKGGPEVHTWGNGQMFGSVLGYAMQFGAKYAATWSMFEHSGDRKGSDYSLYDGKNMTPRASYHHMALVEKYFTGNFIKAAYADSNLIVYGAQHGDQTSVMIMNTSFHKSKAYKLYLDNPKKVKAGLNIVLPANRKELYKDEIPKRSTQVIIFKGNAVTKVTYTSDDFDNERPPVTAIIKNN